MSIAEAEQRASFIDGPQILIGVGSDGFDSAARPGSPWVGRLKYSISHPG